MGRTRIYAAALILCLLSPLYGGRTDALIRTTGTLSLPVSSYVSEYLETGRGGGLSLLIRKNYWPMHLEFEAGYLTYPLQNKNDSALSLIPVTIGLHYTLPFRLFKANRISLFARTGIAVEILEDSGANDINTAFTAGLGARFTVILSSSFETGLSLQYAMLSEKDESASFLHLQLHFDLKL